MFLLVRSHCFLTSSVASLKAMAPRCVRFCQFTLVRHRRGNPKTPHGHDTVRGINRNWEPRLRTRFKRPRKRQRPRKSVKPPASAIISCQTVARGTRLDAFNFCCGTACSVLASSSLLSYGRAVHCTLRPVTPYEPPMEYP